MGVGRGQVLREDPPTWGVLVEAPLAGVYLLAEAAAVGGLLRRPLLCPPTLLPRAGPFGAGMFSFSTGQQSSFLHALEGQELCC